MLALPRRACSSRSGILVKFRLHRRDSGVFTEVGSVLCIGAFFLR
jgi:hypothetical protein